MSTQGTHEQSEWRNEVEPITNIHYIVDSVYSSDSEAPLMAVTIKHCNNKKVDYKRDIDAFLEKNINRYFDTLYKVYETDSDNKLHCHLLCQATPLSIKHRKIRYWHQDIQKLKTRADALRWLNYLNKIDQNYVIDTHYSFHNNMFELLSDTD